jgi:hypothetical protein
MHEITKIPSVIFLIFLFNLTVIFNGGRYLKQNKSSIHLNDSFLTLREFLQKLRKFRGLVKFPLHILFTFFILFYKLLIKLAHLQ